MERMTRSFLFTSFIVAAFVVAVAVSSAQEALTAKPHKEWTQKEVEKLLTDSPWAQTAGLGADTAEMVPNNFATGPGKQWVVRLRSAMPVRLGMLRLRQLKEKYDAMSEEKKAKFDEKNKPLVECPACADNYVVALTPPSTGIMGGVGNLNLVPLEKLKQHVRLTNESGERRELVHFAPAKSPGQEVTFFFARFDAQGRPLLTAASKKVAFVIDSDLFTGGGSASRLNKFEFDVSKMTVGGEVLF